jgi:hypothetical protein
MIKFASGYEKNEWLGREALKDLQIIYPELFKNYIEFTPEGCRYDAFYFIYDNDFKIKKRVFIEIKVRSENWDEPFLEWNKWKDITDIAKNVFDLNDDEYEILYLNFFPNETIVWKIKYMDKSLLVESKMNKATVESTSIKKNKKVWLMDKSVGKSLNYTINEPLLLKRNYDEYLSKLVTKQIKRKPGLEDILFN